MYVASERVFFFGVGIGGNLTTMIFLLRVRFSDSDPFRKMTCVFLFLTAFARLILFLYYMLADV